MPVAHPALLVLGENRLLPLPGPGEFLVGRSPESILTVVDPSCSRRQFLIAKDGAGVFLRPLSPGVPTWLDGKSLDSPARLHHGATIRAGNLAFLWLERDDPERIARAAGSMAATGPADAARTLLGPSLLGVRGNITGVTEIQANREMMLGREPGEGGVTLPHPMVSRRHARLVPTGAGLSIEDQGSANGTFVNGIRADGETSLADGDRLQIGPFRFEKRGDRLVPRAAGSAHLVAHDLVRELPGAQQSRRLLDGVSLAIQPGCFLVLIGASGSGKSTLLDALSARRPADSGRVTLDGVDLYAHFDALKSELALVPQGELLHEELRLEEVLRYTARLRLPPDTGTEAIEAAVNEALAAVELESSRQTPIARLSGGQKRRAALANEIVQGPRVLFIDEATSGLDEPSDREMMRLFRKLADSGVIVVCVTHTLAHVEEYATTLAVMAPGGRLAWIGPAGRACTEFGVDRLAGIYAALPHHGGQSAPAGGEPARDRHEDESAAAPPPPDFRLKTLLPEILRQLGILIARYARVLAADRKAILMALLQCLVVALAMHLAFDSPASGSHQERSFAFLLGVSCFWFGCNNAAREIVKERAIYLRERNVRLSVMAYAASKAIVLGAFGVVQAAILWLLATLLDGMPGDGRLQLAFMATSSLAATMLGLFISAATKTSDQATTLIPIALIPQVVFSGHVNPELPPVARDLARWLVCEYGTNRGMLEAIRTAPDAARLASELGITLAHALVAFLAAFLLLLLKDARDQRIYGHAIRTWAEDARRTIEKAGRRARETAGRARGAGAAVTPRAT